MRVLDRFLKRDGRVSNDAVLGNDILDLSPFGGRWQRALAQVMGSERAVSGMLKALSGPRNHWGDDEREVMGRLNDSWRTEPRLMIAVGAAMDPSVRQQFGKGWGYSCDWSAAGVITAAWRRPDGTGGKPDAPRHGRLSITDLERLSPVLGWPTGSVIACVVDGTSWRAPGPALADIEGMESYVIGHADTVRAAVAPPVKQDMLRIWQRLDAIGPAALAPFVTELAHAAAAGSKAVRKEVVPMLAELPPDNVEVELRAVAEAGPAIQTAHALNALARLANPDRLPHLAAWAGEAMASSRSAAVAEAVRRLQSLESRPDHDRPSLPPTRLSELEPLTALPVLRPASPATSNQRHDTTAMLRTLNGDPHTSAYHVVFPLSNILADQPSIASQLTEEHVARALLTLTYSVTGARLSSLWTAGDPAPLLLSAVADHDGHDTRRVILVVGIVLLTDPTHWTADELGDWVCYHADDIIDVLDHGEQSFGRDGLFTALSRASRRPAHLDDALAARIVGGRKADRERLLSVLGPESIERIVPYLGSRKRAERQHAADWIRHHGVAEATGPLLSAARKESDDTVKAAMLAALEAVDVSIDEFISRDALTAAASRAMAKKNAVPKAMAWLDPAALPPLHWHDGTPVDREVVTFLLANAVKAKSAEPSPIVRRHFSAMDQREVQTFGRVLLDFWITEDLRTFDHDEALAEAQRRAPNYLAWAQRGGGPYANMTQEQITNAVYDELRSTVSGSATAGKGLLAVVAASAGGEVADRALAYIRRHRGQRASQAKALLQMLAWIDDPGTVQAVMAVAARFRPKGIQDEAIRQAELLADRKGWTLDDLADRSVPDGGFDVDGRRVFDYGERTFTARLADDLTVTLVNDETGKSVRSLPKGRAAEDEERIGELKKELTALRKDLKSTAKIQPERLRQAMWAQRTWTVDDFERYLLRHPVMIRLATRVVWRAVVDGSNPVSVRPLTDGTLLDTDDADVDLPPSAEVSITHERLISAAEVAAWRQHLADYEIEPLFPQFGRPVVAIESDDQAIIDDFAGTTITDNGLRSQMNRQVWQLGQPQDGGVAHELVKPIPGAGLAAVLELVEGLSAARYDGDQIISLGPVYFVPIDIGLPSTGNARPLTEVPTVMLSEVYAEVQAMADAGQGQVAVRPTTGRR